MAREAAIAPDKMRQASLWLNRLPRRERRYGFEYLAWMNGGAVGEEPRRTPRLSQIQANLIKDRLHAMHLWGEPRA